MSEQLYEDLIGKKWFDQVGICIHDFARYEFSLREFLSAYGGVLKEARDKGEDSKIEPTVRRVLQELRDSEVIEFVDNKLDVFISPKTN